MVPCLELLTVLMLTFMSSLSLPSTTCRETIAWFTGCFKLYFEFSSRPICVTLLLLSWMEMSSFLAVFMIALGFGTWFRFNKGCLTLLLNTPLAV